jgi:hypothetical protein
MGPLRRGVRSREGRTYRRSTIEIKHGKNSKEDLKKKMKGKVKKM